MGDATRRWLLGTTLSLLLAANAAQGGAPEPLQRVSVRVYDHAGVPAHVLTRAQRELERLFGRMDLGVDLILCYRHGQLLEATCNLTAQPNELHLAIVETVPKELSGKKMAPETCGFALVTGQAMENTRANIFYSCVRRSADEAGVAQGVVLGHLMAHEMGHLLLNTKQHSPSGVLRARLRPEDFRLAAQGRLEFTGGETLALRAAVALRLRPRDSGQIAHAAQSAFTGLD